MGLFSTKIEQESIKIGFGQQNNPKRPSNIISTTKYSILTFIPKALILQFTRAANFIYILSSILQSIKIISSLSPITAFGPLMFVLLVSIIRQGFEDYKRHKKDKQVNQRITEKLIQGEFKQITWENIHPGDIIKVKNTEAIPCDMVLLYTTEENSICYVETSNLDGQTNLKTKYAFNQGITLRPHEFQKLEGFLEIDLPKSQLYQFNGKIKLSNQQQKTLVYQNILLRQTHLKNTHQIVGIAIYCGSDSKIMMNKGHIQHKVTRIQKRVNVIQLCLLVILIAFCTTCSIGYYIKHRNYGRTNFFYLKATNISLEMQSILIFFSNFLLLNFLIPISLNVNLQFIKGVQCIFLGFDNKFKDQFCPNGINVSNMSILEELGLINYVLTDKTGTLTSNNMIFKSCCIQDRIFSNFQLEYNFQTLGQNISFHNFWTSVIICHDVIKDSLTNKYQGSSPDQVCFVEYARKLGYEFSKKTKNYIQLIIKGQKIVYELLYVIPFTMRKRMTVIVRAVSSNNEILMFTKGADSAIFEKSLFNEHQNFFEQNIDDYAKKGLRTLVFSFRKLSQEQFLQIISSQNNLRADKKQKMKSLQQLDNFEKQMIQKFQSQLIILGATAIQDKLQDKVPETISRLQQAGISVMMVTGDKLETAQNIGYLAHLMDKNFKIIKIKSNDQNVFETIKRNLLELETQIMMKIGVIIEGNAIRKIVDQENPSTIEIYAQFLKKCTSVIFCRSSPQQKALIVKFVKNKLKGTVLAIGDGGNDTGMIQAANVGVGILGREGNSAASASDFYFGQFKHLDRLLLHHGRWFYMRTAYYFVYYGWKSQMISYLMFLFLIRSAYSGYPAFSELFIALYSMLIGMYIIAYYAIWAQDINSDIHPDVWHKLPLLYKKDRQNDLFSYKRYITWTILGMFIAVFLDFFINLSIGSIDTSISSNGITVCYDGIYITKSLSLIIITIVVIIMDLKSFTCHTIILALGFFTFGFIFLVYMFENVSYFGRGYKSFINYNEPKIYLVFLVIFGLSIGAKAVIDMLQFQFYPTEVDRILKQKYQKKQLLQQTLQNLKLSSKQIIVDINKSKQNKNKNKKKKLIKQQSNNSSQQKQKSNAISNNSLLKSQNDQNSITQNAQQAKISIINDSIINFTKTKTSLLNRNKEFDDKEFNSQK